MKIVSRKELLSRYNTKYKKTIKNSEQLLLDYFNNRNLSFEKYKKLAYEKLLKIVDETEYKKIKIILYEYPMHTHRSRLTRFGVYSPNAKDNNLYMKDAIKDIKKCLLINTPSEIKIDAYFEMPEKMKPEDVILYEAGILKVVITPDYDNVGKCYTDMQLNNLIVDDDIFYKGIITKYYSLQPRVEILISYQTKHNSDYVYNKLKKRKRIKELVKENRIELMKY